VADAWRFPVYLVRNFIADRCLNTTAALTYQTLFAVVPFVTMLYTVLSMFGAVQDAGRQFEDFVFSNVVPENVAVVQEYLHSFSEQASNLTIPSAMFLAVTVFMMLFTIERTFNEIWKIREPRRGFERLLMYWALLTVAPLLLVAGIAMSTYALSLPLFSDVTESPLLWRVLPVVMSAVTFTLVYIAVPNTLVPLRHAIIGGVLVAAVFETAKFGFGTLMSQSSFQVLYGTFAVVPLFLLWVYTSWMIVLIGAELVKGLGVYRFAGSHSVRDPLVQVLTVLYLFHRAHLRGEVVTERMVRERAKRIDLEHWTDYRSRLMALNLIRPVERGGMVLSRDLAEVTVWQLHESLPWPLPTEKVRDGDDWEQRISTVFEHIEADNGARLKMSIESLFRDNEKATGVVVEGEILDEDDAAELADVVDVTELAADRDAGAEGDSDHGPNRNPRKKEKPAWRA